MIYGMNEDRSGVLKSWINYELLALLCFIPIYPRCSQIWARQLQTFVGLAMSEIEAPIYSFQVQLLIFAPIYVWVCVCDFTWPHQAQRDEIQNQQAPWPK